MKIKKYGLLFVVPLLVAIDWGSKYWVKHNLEFGKSYDILGDLLRFTYIENDGIAFGFLSHISSHYFWVKNGLLFCITVLILAILIREIVKEKNPVLIMGFIFVLAGALGNVLERLFGNIIYFGDFSIPYGQVVDFIDVGIGVHRWFYFNLADSFVSIGIGIVIITSAWVSYKQYRSSKERE